MSEPTIYDEIVTWLSSRVTSQPKIGIICGSGLGTLGEKIEDKISFDYKDIPHFPVSTVQGHKGCLVFGKLNGKEVVCMQGRFHLYEGYSPSICALPMRVFKLLGVESLIITCAAGSINDTYELGDFMVFKDHLSLPNMTGNSSLLGKHEPEWGARFVPLTNLYDKQLRKLALDVGKELNERVQEGIYMSQVGPCYETIAELTLCKLAGCDTVGMSVVPEACVAHQAGIRILAIALVTNCCNMSYDHEATANHKEVLETADRRGKDCVNFVKTIVGRL